MSKKSIHGRRRIVVAQVGDRTYLAPEVCTMFTHDPDYDLTVEVRPGGAAPVFSRIVLARCRLTALEVQHLPWAKIAEAAIAKDTVTKVGRKSLRAEGREVVAARARARKAATRRDSDNEPERRKVDRALLERVLELREEAQGLGVRWDTYAGAQLDYAPTYMRELASRAKREGITRGKR